MLTSKALACSLVSCISSWSESESESEDEEDDVSEPESGDKGLKEPFFCEG